MSTTPENVQIDPRSMRPPNWNRLVQVLHWLGLLLVLTIAVIGLVMVDLPRGSDLRRSFFLLHKSLGMTALALAGLRLLARALTRAPASLSMPSWQSWLAQVSHVLLYALLLAVPLSGWLLNSVAGQPLPWFGLIELPALTGKSPGWRNPVETTHVWLFWTLAGLVCLHALAASHHHWIRGDATLRRMLPGRPGRAG